MLPGYMGKILWIDLSKEILEEKIISPEIARKYIGGTGLSAYLLMKYLESEPEKLPPDPLDEKSPLIFLTGPLTGTKAPYSGRYSVVGRSPQTGIWGESDSGGSFGVRLKAAGYDGIVVLGKAKAPVYLWINEKGVEIREANWLWGKDTYETHSLVQSVTNEKAGIICIGLAGENMLNIASIMAEGTEGRAAGRVGLGAVMGSKKLKAIAASGSIPVPVHDQERLYKSVKSVIPNIVHGTKRYNKYGTAGGVVGNAALGDMSSKNWEIGDWMDGAEKIGGDVLNQNYLVGRYYCPGCATGCGRRVNISRGKYKETVAAGPEYETLAGFGSQLLISDPEIVIEANDLCNRYGLDTISTSGVIAFAMEGVEKGLIKNIEGNPSLVWGNGEAVIDLIHKIVQGEGLGKVLGFGVKTAAQAIGKEAEDFAIHVKGLEPPYHDPRALSSLAVAYATHWRGACHRGLSHSLERAANPQLGYEKVLDRFEQVGKGISTAKMQNYAELYNCLKLCQMIVSVVKITEVLEWLNSVTGWEMDMEEFLKAGERSINLKRLYNQRCGVTGEQDTIPKRFLKEPFSSGGAADFVPDLELMLNEYYSFRGWSTEGNPEMEILRSLELLEFI